MSNETILVIDDNVELVELLDSYILQPKGYKVLWATDGEKGLALALLHEPDLIMLDMHMPRLDGMGVLRALREADHNIPVIFMTVFGSERLAIEAFRLGVRDYLIKPFSFEEVHRTVDSALQTVRLAHEKENLSRNLVMAETVRQTVTTLSHHINNHLMAVSGNLLLLQEAMEQAAKNEQLDWLEMVYNSVVGIEKIEQVLRALQRITQVEPTQYFDHHQMLDLDHVLQQTPFE
ncbi:MAG: response regulator [Chloroflexota bacterium]|nr:response regulator [Anaerolineales bacterium]MCA9975987.1 response regulator [Anaerolineales bacterium]MCB8968494.1 response regulator [Ardenticatenaceae bacterium]